LGGGSNIEGEGRARFGTKTFKSTGGGGRKFFLRGATWGEKKGGGNVRTKGGNSF